MMPRIEAFYDPATNTISYVVCEPDGQHCAVVDSVLDFDSRSGRTGTASADCIIAFVRDHGLRVGWILETHVHADHLSAAPYLKRTLGGAVGIGARICDVQRHFKGVFNADATFQPDGRQFDRLFEDGETFSIGAMPMRVIATPGHTPACASYLAGDAAFVGDTLFMPDFGTARADFPGGDARVLYRSIRKILDLPPSTRLLMCHDYQPGGREPLWETTVAAQRGENLHVRDGIDEDAFVTMRTARDASLDVPQLLFAAIQVNMRAGELPPVEANGVSFLKIPLNLSLG